jgi:hypothetical protein
VASAAIASRRRSIPVLGGYRRKGSVKGHVIVYVPEGETAFLNVDVDVLSATPLERLVAALGRSVSVHYVGREGRGYGAHFALYGPRTADSAIRRLVKKIEKLPRPARKLWDTARHRVFNIGLQSGLRPYSQEFQVTSAAVEAMSRVGGSIAITVSATEARADASAPPN